MNRLAVKMHETAYKAMEWNHRNRTKVIDCSGVLAAGFFGATVGALVDGGAAVLPLVGAFAALALAFTSEVLVALRERLRK